jgi:hypothetical protein
VGLSIEAGLKCGQGCIRIKARERRERQAGLQAVSQAREETSISWGGMKEIRAHTGLGPKHAHMSM